MRTNVLRVAALVAFVAMVAALPSAAQIIPAGKDFWVTPSNGQTDFVFPKGEVEALCGAPTSATPLRVTLKGVPATGSDYDTVVARLDNAVFNSSGNAATRIQVAALNFVSAAPLVSPCGKLDFTVRLAGAQAVTVMKLIRTSDRGGFFSADIAVNTEFRATRGGVYIGSLFYNIVLPDPANGTAWSFGPAGEFRAGMTEADDCIDVLRQKLLNYDVTSDHFYFISDMIAKGQCRKQA